MSPKNKKGVGKFVLGQNCWARPSFLNTKFCAYVVNSVVLIVTATAMLCLAEMVTFSGFLFYWFFVFQAGCFCVCLLFFCMHLIYFSCMYSFTHDPYFNSSKRKGYKKDIHMHSTRFFTHEISNVLFYISFNRYHLTF